MKKSIFSLFVIMLVAGSVFSANHISVANSKDNFTLIQDENDFKEFKKESNEKIINNEKRIAELKVEMKHEKKEARKRDEERIDALEKRNRSLKRKINDYKYDGKSDWKKFRTEVSHDLDGLGQSVKNFFVKNTK